ncbi:MAG: hypothetical protein NW701_02610 [Nitrospira sp.]
MRDRLETLLAQGYADVGVDVGAQLLEVGTNQVEMSDDEGETAEEIVPLFGYRVPGIASVVPCAGRADALCRGAKASGTGAIRWKRGAGLQGSLPSVSHGTGGTRLRTHSRKFSTPSAE